MFVTLEWLKAEADHQGLSLDREDLEAIALLVREAKIGLAAKRIGEAEALQPECYDEPDGDD